MGEALVSVPRRLALTEAAPKISSQNSVQVRVPWYVGLALSMLEELGGSGTRSKWASYFPILPSELNTPVQWDDDLLAQLQYPVLEEKHRYIARGRSGGIGTTTVCPKGTPLRSRGGAGPWAV